MTMKKTITIMTIWKDIEQKFEINLFNINQNIKR
jgi:hypothetical protein